MDETNSASISDASPSEYYRELRCAHCRRLICWEYITAGRVKYECARCGEASYFKFSHRMNKQITQTKNQNDTVSSDQ